MDYFVHDEGDGAVINASGPVDAAQGFIDIVRRVNPARTVDPHDLNIYPIIGKNRLVTPVDTETL